MYNRVKMKGNGRKKEKGTHITKEKKCKHFMFYFLHMSFPLIFLFFQKKPLEKVREFNRGIKEGTEEEG